jgi:hypothetical protein
MLSLGKLAAGPDAGRYYEEAVAQRRDDYYAGEGEAPGQWVGAGAATLGLSGAVEDGEIGRLLAGEDPSSGALLGRRMTEGRLAGYDLTFTAPQERELAVRDRRPPRWDTPISSRRELLLSWTYLQGFSALSVPEACRWRRQVCGRASSRDG